ncbi:tRNA threonylcarbamoyladenosine biosynthesis protein [Williamsoniiplasma luminosum]|uniref:L-threonylcarbamoyladenylate synthase n=1 Tax=Williamsoniiplasma luminosum TaxID=214888 RepID=A0A2K8NT12_9MOLU|nr:Sua5/YciO/YrdC/YwlC family protein [Williamsoniiplasma luminosum]ATZ16972.1 tRNA threonylcarbamoyladenosine biosynthesis protein [Williamsoniiplasma luminosum]
MLTKEQIAKAVANLKDNKIIILPTDTIYGLSSIVNITNKIRINELKKADKNKELITLFSKYKQLKNVVKIDKEIKKFIKTHQNTTIILKTQNGTIALRRPKRKDLNKIINQVGLIYSTSVNTHGAAPLFSQFELKTFHKTVNLYFDREYNATPSRIFDWENKVWVR